jgi:UDP-GlcNAc:undecaprenyl-phosphate GlcNAc-1-phosphate transferase
LAGAFVIFLFGLWDDLKGLSAGPKLVGQCIAATILISSGVQVYFATILLNAGYISPLVAQILNIAVTLVWLFGITNALNMIDSMDGIVAGLGIIASVCFMAATKVANQPVLTFWSTVLLGVCAGLYYWNKLAGKFFLGDSGAQTIGFLLASFGIMYNPLNRNPESSWIVPIMLLGVPIFDTSLVVLSRLRRGQAVGSGRRDHTYHRLIALGVSPRYAVLLVHLAALVISCLAFITLYLPAWLALTFFFVTILGGVALLLWLERKPSLDE